MTKTLREGAPGRTPVVPRTAAENESHSQHTPLPWRAVDDGYGEGDGGCWRIDPAMKDDGMANGYRWFSEDDAEFIVRACNHHEALLDALRTFCGDYESTPTTSDTSLKAAYLHALEVIANAEGK